MSILIVIHQGNGRLHSKMSSHIFYEKLCNFNRFPDYLTFKFRNVYPKRVSGVGCSGISVWGDSGVWQGRGKLQSVVVTTSSTVARVRRGHCHRRLTAETDAREYFGDKSQWPVIWQASAIDWGVCSFQLCLVRNYFTVVIRIGYTWWNVAR